MSAVTITTLDERTFRIVAPEGDLVWGGLGPDSLALGRVSVGPVSGVAGEPGVSIVTCSSEIAVYVCDVPHTWDVFPLGPNLEAPYTCLEDDLSAPEQLSTLRSGIAECLAYAAAHPGLDSRLCAAARRDRAAGRGDRVLQVAQEHLEHAPQGVAAEDGGPAWVPTERLADAVQRITGERPRDQFQVRSLMHRWARRRGTPRRR